MVLLTYTLTIITESHTFINMVQTSLHFCVWVLAHLLEQNLFSVIGSVDKFHYFL